MTSPARPPFPWPLLRFWFRRILPMWSLIAAMIFLFQVADCAIVHDSDQVKALVGFVQILPSIVKASLGGQALQTGSVAAVIAIGYQHPLVLLLYMLFAVAVPTGLLAGEVQQGGMELILSRSVTKTQAYVCAGALTVAGMFALTLTMFLGTVAGTSLYKFEQPIDLRPFFIVAINGGLLASTVGGVALLSAACFRRRGAAATLTVIYLVINYFISIVASLWPSMRPLARLTLFHYVNGPEIFTTLRWPAADMAVLTTLLAVSALAGAIVWRRRDLPL